MQVRKLICLRDESGSGEWLPSNALPASGFDGLQGLIDLIY